MTIYVELSGKQIEIIERLLKSEIAKAPAPQINPKSLNTEPVASANHLGEILQSFAKAEHGTFIPHLSFRYFNWWAPEEVAEELEIGLDEATKFVEERAEEFNFDTQDDAVLGIIHEEHELWKQENNNND